MPAVEQLFPTGSTIQALDDGVWRAAVVTGYSGSIVFVKWSERWGTRAYEGQIDVGEDRRDTSKWPVRAPVCQSIAGRGPRQLESSDERLGYTKITRALHDVVSSTAFPKNLTYVTNSCNDAILLIWMPFYY